DILRNHVRAENAEAFVGGRRAVIDDVHALHVLTKASDFVAVDLVELHAGRDVVEVPTDHVVDADNRVPIGQKRVREVATQEPGDARDKDALFRHLSLLVLFLNAYAPLGAGVPNAIQAVVRISRVAAPGPDRSST